MKPTVYTEKDGERVIAASKRPDGTVRKERRVREGYTPLDEMPVYQSRAAWVSLHMSWSCVRWPPPAAGLPEPRQLPCLQAKQGAPRVPGLAGGGERASGRASLSACKGTAAC